MKSVAEAKISESNAGTGSGNYSLSDYQQSHVGVMMMQSEAAIIIIIIIIISPDSAVETAGSVAGGNNMKTRSCGKDNEIGIFRNNSKDDGI
jgi:hypothetical protein